MLSYTLVVFTEIPELPKFYLVPRRMKHLNGVYINASNTDPQKADELYKIMYKDDKIQWQEVETPIDPYNIGVISEIIHAGLYI